MSFANVSNGLPKDFAEIDHNKNQKLEAKEVQAAIDAYIFGDPRFDEAKVDRIIEYYFTQFEE
jgi:hypothetical protein